MSQLTEPGIQMVPGMLGPDVFGLGNSYDPAKLQDFYARTLAKVCEPVVRHYSADKALLINYRRLPDAVWTTILPHFGVAASQANRATMAVAARRDAKAPSFEFTGDIVTKQQAATELTRAAAAERLGEIYAQLETLRRADARSA